MDSSLFRTIFVTGIGFLALYISNQENREHDSFSSSSSLRLSSPSLCLSNNWTHDVFPSFHGEDVRKDFLSHIQKGFERKGIRQFNDNEMERGESISFQLVRAIRGSKIAVVLFSKNYASSKWCLDELVEIMKCRREFGQIVIAVFYKVDPSDIRKQTGDFGKVFRKTCAGKTNEEIRRWRVALAEVAAIAGYHSSNWDNEADMVENIATDVSKKLTQFRRSIDFNYDLVGMGSHLEEMRRLLYLDSDEVRMIGIWGLPGVGKSTITRFLFKQLSQRFNVSLYIKDINALYTRPASSDVEFMSLLTYHNDNEVLNLRIEREKLKRKKVLVVIDNVDRSVQLDAMMKESPWFGPGSRVVVAVQDRDVLEALRIGYVYRVALPSDYEAMQIFCMAAFGQKFPKDGYEDLARRVCNIAGRLPLRLKIMGSYFRGMSKQEWIDKIDPL
ncbi:probable disease resistance protein RPP1 [Brassica rapa]|nr:probable disease resistance protein RPP1 [Brassica rapa]XP_013710538.1 probable disease resistance protein RPP1 [Brassica napus]XP_048600742.1 probable disease resistance protein RPP1 [Brassica napus]